MASVNSTSRMTNAPFDSLRSGEATSGLARLSRTATENQSSLVSRIQAHSSFDYARIGKVIVPLSILIANIPSVLANEGTSPKPAVQEQLQSKIEFYGKFFFLLISIGWVMQRIFQPPQAEAATQRPQLPIGCVTNYWSLEFIPRETDPVVWEQGNASKDAFLAECLAKFSRAIKNPTNRGYSTFDSQVSQGRRSLCSSGTPEEVAKQIKAIYAGHNPKSSVSNQSSFMELLSFEECSRDEAEWAIGWNHNIEGEYHRFMKCNTTVLSKIRAIVKEQYISDAWLEEARISQEDWECRKPNSPFANSTSAYEMKRS